MGIKFRQLWNNPEFIDLELKETINLEVEKINKIIESKNHKDISTDKLGKNMSSPKV